MSDDEWVLDFELFPHLCDDITVEGDPCANPPLKNEKKCATHLKRSNIIEYHPDMDELPLPESRRTVVRRQRRKQPSYKPRPKWLDRPLGEHDSFDLQKLISEEEKKE